MKGSIKKTPAISFVRKLCAHLSEKEILDAEERFASYMKIIVKIFERIEGERHDGS
jgi:hypothetical protein